MDVLRETLLILGVLGAATVGGVFFAFSSFVMAALRRLPTGQGIAAMQSINRTVINPWFLGVFLGTGAVCAALAVWSWLSGDARMIWHAAGAAVYGVGSIGVTMAANVPRNERLARVDAGADEAASAWARYARAWTWWNHVRTAASLAAAGVMMVGR